MSDSLAGQFARANPETEPFWQAAAEGRLLLRRCRACGRCHWYPRALCPHCFSADGAWVEASGRGTVYSYSRVATGDAATIIAYVTLEEGPTIMTGLVGVTGALAVGQPVRVVFEEAVGRMVPKFTPAAGG